MPSTVLWSGDNVATSAKSPCTQGACMLAGRGGENAPIN